jgi:hypothetical protein
MLRLQVSKHSLIALVLPVVVHISSAASTDPKLIALVPADAQIVAGINALPPQGQPDRFVLITHDNTVDLQDFFALSGADGSRTIDQVVFVAIANSAGQLSEHGLLVSGHFDQPHIYKSAAEGGATVTYYRGIPVLVVQPFAREQGAFNEVRWLAVLDSHVLVFGTIDTLRRELDRYSASSPAYSSLLSRLAHLRSKDQSWCLLAPPIRNDEIRGLLATLDPKLADIAEFGGSLAFGIHYGRRVEFEYEVTVESRAAGRPTLQSPIHSPAISESKALLFPTLNIIKDDNTTRGVISISMARYRAWLAEVRRYAERIELPKDGVR